MNTPINSLAYSALENDVLEKQRETFVASLSHDLKNPTIAQIRAIELILKGKFGQILPEQREIMEMLLDSCKYMNAMLCSILTTYRCEKGKIELKIEKATIRDLAEECVNEMIFLAKEKGINIIFKNMAEDTLWVDIVQLRRVIMNLLSNSIKYGYPHTELKVKTYNEGKYTCFQLENRSPYLTPEKQEKIFAKYISFSKTHSGVGLGLYASKKIVEAHEGTMFVQSFQDERNIFGFKIPKDSHYKNVKRYVTF